LHWIFILHTYPHECFTTFSTVSHEFEEVIGETPKIYNFGVVVESEEEEAADAEEEAADAITEDTEEGEEHSEEEEGGSASSDSPEYTGWSEKRLPMAVFKPFGYSAGPTQLMTACFWLWLVFGVFLHAWKYMSSKKLREAEESANAERDGAKTVDEPVPTTHMDESAPAAKDEVSTDEENNSREG
jgi:high-affinity iron transporter